MPPAPIIFCPLLSHRRHTCRQTKFGFLIPVYIVRHAQAEENKQKIIQGHLDTNLNSEGEKEADLVAKALKVIPLMSATPATSSAPRLSRSKS